jgi:Cys-tRNA(Pro)/Cys-tRNA(Cys) deacylase
VHPNVAHVLTGKHIPFRVLKHADFPEPIQTPADFARQLGYDLARITKTLLVRAADRSRFALVVAPIGSRVDFKRLATAMGVQKVEVASPPELQKQTGYPRNGVSPLGVDGTPVFIEDSLLQFETILIGSGETAVEIEIPPHDLLSLTAAISLACAT